MTRILAARAACLLLAACQTTTAPTSPAAAGPRRVVILGDGHTAASAAVPGSAGWADSLALMAAQGVAIDNFAGEVPVDRFLAAGGLQQALAQKPEVALVSFGRGDRAALAKGLATIAATCRDQGVTVLFVTPPAIRTVDPVTAKVFPDATNRPQPDIEGLAQTVRDVAKEAGVPVLDLQAWTKKTWGEIGDRACFFLHPPRDPAAVNASNVRKGWVSPAHRNPLLFSVTGADTLAHWIAIQLRATPLGAAIRPVDGPPSPDYKLVWQDEFNGASWSTNDWNCHSGARKDGWNNPDNVKVDGKGSLVFRIERGPTNQIFCGVLDTRNARLWKYGYFESRCTIAREPGMWNAFWLTGNKMADPERGRGKEDDTFSNGTEVDALEYLVPQGDVVHMNLHWNGYKAMHKSSPFDALVPGLREQEYHVYGVDWRPDGYTFYCDGRRMWDTKDAISGTELFLLLSVEIGKWAGDIANAKLPHEIKYDWVRVWQKPAP